MKLDIPYYSQYRDVEDKNWQKKACGLMCLKMVLDFYGAETPTSDDFLKMALEKKAFGENGWIHDELLEIAFDFGVEADRKEFENKEIGVEFALNFLGQEQPIIVSVAKKFKYPGKFHQVVLTGFEMDDKEAKGFYYNDPDYQGESEGKNLFVSIDIFKKNWRKMAIFTRS